MAKLRVECAENVLRMGTDAFKEYRADRVRKFGICSSSKESTGATEDRLPIPRDAFV